MKKLLEIEWRKNYNYLAFWLILGLHYFFVVTFLSNINNFAGSMNISTDQYKNIDLGIVPMFRFPDIWQNIAYLAGFFKILLGIYVVISVTNEYQFNTIRMNISSGLTRLEFILGKVYWIFMIGIFSVLVLFGLGLSLGLSHQEAELTAGIFTGTDFLLGYFIEVLFYMAMALFIAVWLKRTGISIVIMLIYPLLIEPLLRWQTPDTIDRFFPVKSMDRINVFPFQKYFGGTVQSHIPFDSTVIAICWIGIFIAAAYLLLKRSDL